jgi:hypothetical protein
LARYDHDCEDMVSVWSILDGFSIPTRYPKGVPDSIPARIFKYAASQADEMEEDILELVREE